MEKIFSKTSRYSTESVQTETLGIASPVPMGSWNKAIMYQKLNYVRHNQATYLAKKSNTNFEPGVATNWEDVWMLFNYDGGSVSPDGTYPNMTVGNSPKSLYNLGAFDTYVDNGDGTVTVTRKTGYVVINGTEPWNPWGGSSTVTNKQYYLSKSENRMPSKLSPMLGAESFKNNRNYNIVTFAIFNNDTNNIMGVTDNEVQINIPASADVNDYLGQNPIYIQYELATSYTEKVILDQPIHTLDVNGEQFVRNEWEKTLNINSYSRSDSRDGFTWTYDENDQSLTFNGEQTLSNRQFIYLVSNLKSGYYTAIIHVISGSFTTATENTTNSVLRVGTNHGKSSYNSGYNYILTSLSSPGTYKLNFIIDTSDGQVANFVVMNALRGTTGNTLTNYKIQIALYEGDVDYPFYPYNGAIVHEMRMPLYFSTDNVSPASIYQIGGDWTSLGSFTIGSNTVYAWKKA